MIVFPNAKINLGLRVLNKRTDGYHNIESYLVPVNFCDALEIVPSSDGFVYSETGTPVKSSETDNLVIRAYRSMEVNFKIKPVKIHLHKIIPVGAGLGGGSSDAAYTLTLLRRLFDLRICNNELEDISGKLGSDCPFFINNKPQKIEGTGKPVNQFLRLPQYHILIVIPDIQLSTAWAYSVIKPSGTKLPERELIVNHELEWKNILINDFEEPIFTKYPILAKIKQDIYSAGAFYASMSGSGSSIYGLFKEEPQIGARFSQYFSWQGKTGN